LPDGEVTKEQSIEEGEDGGIRADSQSEREYSHCREAGILAQDAKGIG
jgi:hypothetical protein